MTSHVSKVPAQKTVSGGGLHERALALPPSPGQPSEGWSFGRKHNTELAVRVPRVPREIASANEERSGSEDQEPRTIDGREYWPAFTLDGTFRGHLAKDTYEPLPKHQLDVGFPEQPAVFRAPGGRKALMIVPTTEAGKAAAVELVEMNRQSAHLLKGSSPIVTPTRVTQEPATDDTAEDFELQDVSGTDDSSSSSGDQSTVAPHQPPAQVRTLASQAWDFLKTPQGKTGAVVATILLGTVIGSAVTASLEKPSEPAPAPTEDPQALALVIDLLQELIMRCNPDLYGVADEVRILAESVIQNIIFYGTHVAADAASGWRDSWSLQSLLDNPHLFDDCIELPVGNQSLIDRGQAWHDSYIAINSEIRQRLADAVVPATSAALALVTNRLHTFLFIAALLMYQLMLG